ncbi:AIG2-like protein D isoform X2 [Amborella trichopoda]|uniref:AIG2-like protein D isoform X2 n=1 Tax=Amborella trichopoda TaxID=13333 RepID=UPI0009C171BE|nr:AIG2-like protein D isoform X2 [Amborella trichopoda]|eukprot:XP_011625768.2 AIG2-like protein D isoform X2 [Amborella trichopoda]
MDTKSKSFIRLEREFVCWARERERERERMSSNVFVYGSLLAEEVVQVLLKRVPPSSPALLNDFQRFSIKGRVYPAILPVDKKQVTGKVLLGISDYELYVLDTFEDVEYERKLVEISRMDTSEKLPAHTYVWGKKDDLNLCGDWDFDWKEKYLNDFVEMAKGFIDELDQPESLPRVATYESYFQNGERAST